MSILTEIMDPRYVGLRRYLYDYHIATDDYVFEPEKGRKEMEVVIADLADFKRNTIANKSAFPADLLRC